MYKFKFERSRAKVKFTLATLGNALPTVRRLHLFYKKINPKSYKTKHFLLYPITLEGRRGTKDNFATIPFHLVLYSAPLVELAKSFPVHSLILSSHLFFFLPLFRFLFSMPYRISLLNQKTLKHGQTILTSVS